MNINKNTKINIKLETIHKNSTEDKKEILDFNTKVLDFLEIKNFLEEKSQNKKIKKICEQLQKSKEKGFLSYDRNLKMYVTFEIGTPNKEDLSEIDFILAENTETIYYSQAKYDQTTGLLNITLNGTLFDKSFIGKIIACIVFVNELINTPKKQEKLVTLLSKQSRRLLEFYLFKCKYYYDYETEFPTIIKTRRIDLKDLAEIDFLEPASKNNIRQRFGLQNNFEIASVQAISEYYRPKDFQKFLEDYLIIKLIKILKRKKHDELTDKQKKLMYFVK